ncbi:MAG: protein kinase domain-containing protein [Persicimonas sp.]
MEKTTQPQAHLLVVDDQEMNREMLSRRLKRRDYQVTVAVDGLDALEKVEQEDFDLVLLDIRMPRMNGLEVLQRLREEHSVTELPVIMTTAESASETVVEALRDGANDYITKPLDFGVVLARIKTHLEIKRTSRGRAQSGGFAKLSDSGKHRAISSQLYCPRCRSTIQDEPVECPECQRPRPEEGWSSVSDGTYPYLGRTIGDRYFLSRFVASGSAGAVYRARDLEINRDYAAKIVDLDNQKIGVGGGEIRERTTREVEVLSQLSNPHIVKIYDVVVVEDNVFALLLDYVRGYSLDRVLERAGSFSVLNALDIARQVAQALHEAHELDIVHCDIKPENIMLEKMPIRGHFARLLDFGIAEILSYKKDQHGYYGTPYYSAPEQVDSPDKIDHRTDIYALGTVIYHMLAGRPPYEGNNPYEVLTKHLNEPIPSLELSGPHAADAHFLDDLVARMMAKDPEDRFDDLSGFLDYVDLIIPVFQQRQVEEAMAEET